MNSKNRDYDVIVIGGGPAGSTAAMYTSRANLSTLVIDKGIRAGALGSTSKISNFPGVQEIGGVELLENIQNQAKSFGAEYLSDKVISLNLQDETKSVFTNSGEFTAKSVILATGSMGRKSNIIGEKELLGRGVSYCATCDGAFYKNDTVAVVGNNDEALEELLFLTKFADKIFLINPQNSLKAKQELIDAVENNPKVKIIKQAKTLEVKGNFGVDSIIISTKENPQKEIKVSGVFIYLQGNTPILDYSMGQLSLTKDGCVDVSANMETSVNGIYAIGDLLCTHPKQVAIATSDGVIAAMAVDRWLNNKSIKSVDWKK